METKIGLAVAISAFLLAIFIISVDLEIAWWVGVAGFALCGGSLLVLAYSFRRSTRSQASGRLSDMDPYLLGPGAQQLLAFERRFREDEQFLSQRFPEDPLDNPAIVELFSFQRHDAPDIRKTLENDYKSWRQRYIRWQQSVQKIPVDPVVTSAGAVVSPIEWCEQKVTEAAELRAFAEDLEKQAEALHCTVDQSVAEVARAAEALLAARTSYKNNCSFPGMPDRASELDTADMKLEQARSALRKGAENPRAAFSLARQVVDIATSVSSELATASKLPEVVEARLETYETRRSEVDEAIKRIHADFARVSAHHAPSVWTDISGAGAAAEQALTRADQSYHWAREQERSHLNATAFELMVRRLDESLATLEEALSQAQKIADRIAMVEEAAEGARDHLSKAEVAIDRAWALSRGNSVNADEDSETLNRAAKYIEQGRAEMTKPQPDWLMITGLAERAQALAELTSNETKSVDSHALVLSQLITVERERAKAARDRVWAVSIGNHSIMSNPGFRPLVDGIETTYQTALTVEAEALAGGVTVVNAEAADAAIHAFRNVVEMASEFSAQTEQKVSPEMPGFVWNRRNQAEFAELVVWGVAGVAAAWFDSKR